MGLLDAVRAGVAAANKVTADLQPNVLHEAAIVPAVRDVFGNPARAAAVARPGLVEDSRKVVKTASGELVQARAKITFLDPAVVVQSDDKLTLPDGTTGPILEVRGFVDRGTGKPILSEVYLG